MHHIFRVASLTHGNFIDNYFKPRKRSKYWKHPYPYLEYVLNKSYHTRDNGYTLFEGGCLSTSKLEKFNDYKYMREIYNENVKASVGTRYRGGSKIYQSNLMYEILRNSDKKFKPGIKVRCAKETDKYNMEIVSKESIGRATVKHYRDKHIREWNPEKHKHGENIIIGGYVDKIISEEYTSSFRIENLEIIEVADGQERW